MLIERAIPLKIGCCAPIEQAAAVHAAGFDYIECMVTALDPEGSEEAFVEKLNSYEQSPLPIEACNVFLPGDLKIVGPTVDEDRVKKYLENAIQRVHRIGAEVIVFGSGGARMVPEDFDRKRAQEQITQFLHWAADVAEPLGVTIVIEPLNQTECNIINSVAEGVEFVDAVNRSGVQVLADLYHIEMDQEPLENVSAAGLALRHVHVADTGRLAPGTGQYPYPAFAEELRQINYDGRVSVECRWQDFAAEAPKAVSFLRSQLASLEVE